MSENHGVAPPADQPAANGQEPDFAEGRATYGSALVAEIRILVRAIANDPNKRLSDLSVEWRDTEDSKPRKIDFAQIVYLIGDMEKNETSRTDVGKLGLLQAIKDNLIALTKPATGLTISYTALVTGSNKREPVDSTIELARRAYGNLERQARSHGRLITMLSFLAIILALFAAWEATKASLGKDLLQSLDVLHVQQASLTEEKTKAELNTDKDSAATMDVAFKATGIAESMIPLCDRSLYLRDYLNANYIAVFGRNAGGQIPDIRLSLSALERELCGKDEILRSNLRLVHIELLRYNNFWPDLVGGPFAAVGHAAVFIEDHLRAAAGNGNVGGPPGTENCDRGADAQADGVTSCKDVEFVVAPVVRVISSYTLPLIFGILGSLLYVLLEHYTSMRSNTLSPRDQALTHLRVILGVVVAACVSLLISSYSGPSPSAGAASDAAAGNLVTSLALSASGITFLAGFGAEAVFTLLQALVTRVFSIQK
jgi:hypothetical protein